MHSLRIFVSSLCFLLRIFKIRGSSRESPKLYKNREDSIKRIATEFYHVFKFTTQPSDSPTREPSENPTIDPSDMPTTQPTLLPTLLPSLKPSISPSNFPTNVPSFESSASPSVQDSDSPSLLPTSRPSEKGVPSITTSPSEIYTVDTPNSSNAPLSYFNYNPYDTNFGPGVPSLYNESIIIYNSTQNFTHTMNYTYYANNTWKDVRDSMESLYWLKFDMGRTMKNKCESSPFRKQSPIDLCSEHLNAECLEHHQIRNRGGDYNLDDTEVSMKILPSKLRIEYSLENAALNETKLRPPHGDFAHNWNGYIQVTHIDIKIPSEHTICGKRFAGEYQIYYYHPKRRQPIVQSVLIEIHPKERKHKHFQKALNEWQAVFDEQHANCLNAEREYYKNEERFVRRMENVLLTEIDNPNISLRSNDGLERHGIWNRRQSTILDEPEEETQRFHSILQKIRRRAADPKFEENYEKISFGTNSLVEGEEEAQGNSTQVPSINERGNLRTSKSPSTAPSSAFFESETPQPSITPSSTSPPSDQPTTFPSARIRWNPFHPRIVNSIYFYGYGGSLTEPPCSEWVSWRVLDTPMQISTAQWTQMRDILFGQLDGDCKRSSVHWRGSVARPTQGLNGRPLWKCTRDDYVSDVEKRRPSAAPSETTI